MITTLRDAVVNILWEKNLFPEQRADKIIELCERVAEARECNLKTTPLGEMELND